MPFIYEGFCCCAWPILPLRIQASKTTVDSGNWWNPWYWTTGSCCIRSGTDQYNRHPCLEWDHNADVIRAASNVKEMFTESMLRLFAESLGEEFVLQTMGSESFEIPDEGMVLDSVIGGTQLRAPSFSDGSFGVGTTITKSVTSYTRVFWQLTATPYTISTTYAYVRCNGDDDVGPHDGIIDTSATTTTSEVLANDSASYRLFLISKGLPEDIRVTHLPSGGVKIYELGTADTGISTQWGSAFYKPRQYP